MEIDETVLPIFSSRLQLERETDEVVRFDVVPRRILQPFVTTSKFGVEINENLIGLHFPPNLPPCGEVLTPDTDCSGVLH